jgi:hypothetical protein
MSNQSPPVSRHYLPDGCTTSSEPGVGYVSNDKPHSALGGDVCSRPNCSSKPRRPWDSQEGRSGGRLSPTRTLAAPAPPGRPRRSPTAAACGTQMTTCGLTHVSRPRPGAAVRRAAPAPEGRGDCGRSRTRVRIQAPPVGALPWRQNNAPGSTLLASAPLSPEDVRPTRGPKSAEPT